MINAGLVRFKKITDDLGCLTPIEGTRDIPFEMKRIYYITQVQNGVIRGRHAHKYLHQVLICMHGSVKIRLKTPFEEEVVLLGNPFLGLYIGAMIWREMFDFSSDAVLLVLASEHFDEADYIRIYSEYEEQAKKLFENEVRK